MEVGCVHHSPPDCDNCYEKRSPPSLKLWRAKVEATEVQPKFQKLAHNPVTNFPAASSQRYSLLKKDKKGFDFLVIRK